MIKKGMLVRYAPGWCSPGEEKYFHVVQENVINPVTGKMTRWIIETINSSITIANPTETVEEYMIIPAE